MRVCINRFYLFFIFFSSLIINCSKSGYAQKRKEKNGKHKRTTLLHIKITYCLIALLTFFIFSNVFLFLLIKKKKKVSYFSV